MSSASAAPSSVATSAGPDNVTPDVAYDARLIQPSSVRLACPHRALAVEGMVKMTPFIMATMLLGLNLEVVPMCFSGDVKQLCCPSACATKNSPKWTQANDVLRGCMKGIGCSDGESRNVTVGLECNCGSK